MPGIFISTTRHAVLSRVLELRKLSADSKAAARRPNDSMSSLVVLRMDSSSSTIEMRAAAIGNSPHVETITKASINLLGIGGARVTEE
jgi:hypothetical protein